MKIRLGALRRLIKEVSGDVSIALLRGDQASSLLYDGAEHYEQEFDISVEEGPGGACEVIGTYDNVVACLEALGMTSVEIQDALDTSSDLHSM